MRGRGLLTYRAAVGGLLSRDQPLRVGGTSVRCHADGICLSFPIGQAVPVGVASRRYYGDRSARSRPRSPIGRGFPGTGGSALPMAAALEAALGTACCWGFSPALDLHEHGELCRHPSPVPPQNPLAGFLFPGNPGFFPVPDAGGGDVTALLVGAAEGRHLLLTVSRAHREPRSAVTVRLPGGGGGGAVTGRGRLTAALPVTGWPRRRSSWPSSVPRRWLGSSSSFSSPPPNLRGAPDCGVTGSNREPDNWGEERGARSEPALPARSPRHRPPGAAGVRPPPPVHRPAPGGRCGAAAAVGDGEGGGRGGTPPGGGADEGRRGGGGG